ncbi:strictosidine synthase-related [Schistosoma mansoni]|uniref:strictosidine synthase-related n=1 Tax=Schistosoma mansoni TaxID=6183 RepID=UPI0001A62E1F|nr:strictosidine synthase-related [Schistosoma mansoni]|eukprot:XP_018650377.1 strictosidine synthase-related [Schistosoma mansoni]
MIELKKLVFRSIIVICIGYILHCLLNTSTNSSYIYHVKPSIELNDQLIINKKYGNLEKIDLINYNGPESLIYHNGSLYTTVIQGKILRINDSGIYIHATLGSLNCIGVHECGRPLGLKLFNNSENFLVTDAYLGVLSVSVKDGSVKKLFPLDENFKVTFFDDSVILPNGSLIITEASTKNTLQHLWTTILEGLPSGRLTMVDTRTGQYSHIMDGLRFPNGIELCNDGKSILVVETMKLRVLRIPLDGGEVTVFSDGLPGYPDNIKASPRGGYWVPVSNLRDEPLSVLLLNHLPAYPRIRQLASSIISMLPFKPTPKGKSSMLIRLDENGQIIEIWKDLQNELPNACEVLEHDDILYTGSFYLPYIGRLKRLSN